MKILAITSHYPPYHIGGYELRCKNVVDQLSSRGHEIRILASSANIEIRGGLENERNIYRQFHLLDPSKNTLERLVRDYKDVRFLHRLIDAFEPDLIYIWQVSKITKAIFPYLAESNIPIVYDEGGASVIDSWMHRGSWYSFIERKSNSGYKNITKTIIRIFVSIISGGLIKKQWIWPQNMHIYFNSELGKSNALEKRISLNGAPVILPGVDTRQFSFRDRRGITLPIRIVVPGRIEPKKGQRDAVLLLSHLQAMNIAATLTIVGRCASDSYYQFISKTIHELNMEMAIDVLPMIGQEELVYLYQEADICFFPSIAKTGLSRIPLEAMACGCLVMTYGNEGSNEVIEDGRTGYIFAPGDYESMATIIQAFIDDPETYRQIISRARQVIEDKYSMDMYVDKIEAILVNALKSAPHNTLT